MNPLEVQSASEQRTFKLHPAIIYQIIQAQSGTLGKALLELVMNSIDAGATRCDIEYDQHQFRVSDDGKGFGSRREIEEFFEVFGTPHTEADAKFGKFRIGRGQIMAFTTNVWRSGGFKMTVDIKNRGIDYLLEETQTIHQGCTVEGKFYEPLLPSEFQGLARELAKLTAYCEIPIVANGKTLNTHPDTAEWDLVDEDCYVRVRQTGPLLVYNQGAFVQENDAYKFGFGGVVVSRKPLQLNQARNDVLAKLCPVWQRIAARLKVLSGEHSSSSGVRLSHAARVNLIYQLVSAEVTYGSVSSKSLLTDANGKHFSLEKLSRTKLPVSVADDSDAAVAEAILRRHLALVLHRKSLEAFGCDDLNSLVELLVGICERKQKWVGGNVWLKEDSFAAHRFRKLTLVPLAVLAAQLSNDLKIVEPKELKEPEKVALTSMWYGGCIIRDAVRAQFHSPDELTGKWPEQPRLRSYCVGESETSLAWTDGVSFIAIERKHLGLVNSGYAGFVQLALTILHEYLHDQADSGTHVHGEEFYRLFHDIAGDTERDTIGRAAQTMFGHFSGALQRKGLRLNRRVLADADRVHRFEQTVLAEAIAVSSPAGSCSPTPSLALEVQGD